MSGYNASVAEIACYGVEREDFARAVVAGLSKPQKELPCRFFYDEAGSLLFEDITRLDEYYPTRTEAAILAECAGDISSRTTQGSTLVEFGSGSSTKTEILIEAMPQLAAYVAIDVSQSALDDARQRIAARFPALRLETLVADFAALPSLPESCQGAPALGFFPGSTIGNLTRIEAAALLRRFAVLLGARACLVIGVDLKKDLGILLPAYNDAQGVTAAFNLNLLVRINRELAGDFDLRHFRHEARWNETAGRIEMHLISERAQRVRIGAHEFAFAAGESIHTENSHKYTIAEFQTLAAQAGWKAREVWTDPRALFSVHELEAHA